ncbi:MAG TPA: hypothetical protein VG015_01660 [Candidatus Dormibacteraeota bacterium]|jgi:hypothetical protein|nr:hypothetical protein [Candidatus Dormibacteraeota bacterium]
MKRLVIAIVALVALEGLFWVFLGGVSWVFRDFSIGPPRTSAYIASETRIAILEFGWAAIHVLAIVAFLLRRTGLVFWVVVGVQVLDLIRTGFLTAGTVSQSEWSQTVFGLVAAAGPLATLTLLFLLGQRMAPSRVVA